MCAAIYARKELGITDRFAFISPCIAKKLERAGFLLVIIQLLCYAGSVIMTHILRQTVHLAYYEIKAATFPTSTFIIIGLALMVFSQIILMGKDLKEEQELTI